MPRSCNQSRCPYGSVRKRHQAEKSGKPEVGLQTEMSPNGAIPILGKATLPYTEPWKAQGRNRFSTNQGHCEEHDMSLGHGCHAPILRSAGFNQQIMVQDKMNKPLAEKKINISCTKAGERAWGTLLRLYEDVTLGGQSGNFSRPQEVEEMLLRQPLYLRRLQRQLWPLVSLCLGT